MTTSSRRLALLLGGLAGLLWIVFGSRGATEPASEPRAPSVAATPNSDARGDARPSRADAPATPTRLLVADPAIAGETSQIHGRVVDATGGPIEGALVVAASPPSRGPARLGATQSDADGAFVLEFPRRRDRVRVRASAESYSVGELFVFPGARGVELALMPESSIHGRVIDSDGSGIAGAVVTSKPWIFDARVEPEYATTDADGDFGFRQLGPGSYRFQVDDGVYYSEIVETKLAAAEAQTGVVIAARRGVMLSVTLVTEDDRRCMEGGGISVDPNRRGVESSAAPGQWSVAGLAPGTVSLTAYCDGYRTAARELELDSDTTIEIPLERGQSFAGLVRTHAGEPIEGAVVQWVADHNSTKTDAEGRFEFTGLDPGGVDFDVRAFGFLPTEGIHAEPDGPEVEVVLERGECVAGRLDSPAPTFLGTQANSRGPVVWVDVGPTGEFELCGLTVGESMTLALFGDTGQTPVPFRLDAGPVVTKTELTVRDGLDRIELIVEGAPDGELSGVVLAEGGPVNDALVVLLAEAPTKCLFSAPPSDTLRLALTDRDGNFGFESLWHPLGRLGVVVLADGYRPRCGAVDLGADNRIGLRERP